MEDCEGSVLSSTTDVKVVDQCGICGGSSIQCSQCMASSGTSSFFFIANPLKEPHSLVQVKFDLIKSYLLLHTFLS